VLLLPLLVLLLLALLALLLLLLLLLLVQQEGLLSLSPQPPLPTPPRLRHRCCALGCVRGAHGGGLLEYRS
jgi:hypothetical protein